LGIENVVWDMDDEPEGNVRHIAEHGLTKEDVEEVLLGIHELDTSRTTGRPIGFGFTSTGAFICVIFEWLDEATAYPITAYVLEE
jgi:hypothetical protein